MVNKSLNANIRALHKEELDISWVGLITTEIITKQTYFQLVFFFLILFSIYTEQTDQGRDRNRYKQLK